MQRAFLIHGIAFIEIISPCPPTFGELNSFEDGYAQMEYLRKYSVIDDHADLRRAGISMKEPEQIVLGNFIDERKSTYEELETSMIRNAASGQNGAS
jgi:pyruvate/2-oxoacid:ferredoxin oxidoreductase beta subunit